MRKLLSLLSVLTVGTVATTNVVACSNKSSLTPVDQTNLPFLYHVAQVTNLGNVKKDANSILAAFQKANSNLKEDKTLKVTDITDKTATINVNEYDTNYKKGRLKVTFNTIDSTNLSKLITVQNITANRNLTNGIVSSPTEITKKDIVDGINAMNGLNLTENDITVEGLAPNTIPTSVKISAASGSKYQGSNIPLLLNQGLDISKILSNTDLGKVYVPKELFEEFTDVKNTIPAIGMLMEYIGDANLILAQYKDVLGDISTMTTPGVVVFDKSKFTFNASVPNVTLAKYFKNSVTFNFELTVDNRLGIQDAIKTTDLGKLKDNNINTIKQAIIDKNQAQLSKFTKEEINRYLIVTLPDPNNSVSATVSWLAGSKQFLGHDPFLMSIVNSYGFTIPPLTTNVYFGIINNDFKIKDKETGKAIFTNIHSYLKDKFNLSQADSAANIADFSVWYQPGAGQSASEISNSDTQVDKNNNTPVTIKITVKKTVDKKYEADLKKLTDAGFIAGNTYVSNTAIN